MADLFQAGVFPASDRAKDTQHPYAEMQQTTGEYDEAAADVYLVEVFSALIIPVILLGGLVWLVKRATRQTQDAVQAAAENTAVILRNNELLQENIALQKEILVEMRKQR